MSTTLPVLQMRQSAMRRRLAIVRTLLSNENAGIRQVVLEHVTDLIRGNRELFHALVENDRDMSMKHYITVAEQGTVGKLCWETRQSGFSSLVSHFFAFPGASRGTVTEFVEALLSRCVHETDQEARVLLATCLGEVGAVGAHKLEERTSSSYGIVKSKQAPWHSRPNRYQLELVTNQLVAALKAAPSSNDQHKVAFTIQQILALLDRAAHEGDSKSTKKPTRRESKPAMNKWLRSKLSEAGVLEVVEPYWMSEFCQVSTSLLRAIAGLSLYLNLAFQLTG